jgi:hypothetical protein
VLSGRPRSSGGRLDLGGTRTRTLLVAFIRGQGAAEAGWCPRPCVRQPRGEAESRGAARRSAWLGAGEASEA